MGAWGTAVFSDDGACDVRDGFRELVAEGFSSEDATARLVSEYQLRAEDSDCGAEWIGLAVTQWKAGRLLDWVRDRALQAIAAESEALWTDPADWRKRQKVLASTVAMLNSPQRQAVKIKREVVPESPFAAGDVVRFTLDSGREVALWALTRKEHKTLVRVSVDTPFILLAFGDPTLEPVEDLVVRRPVMFTTENGHSSFAQLHLWLPQDAKEPRWSVVGNAPVPSGCQDPRTFLMPLMLRGRGRKPDEVANAAFSDLYESSQRREPAEATEAVLALGEIVPGVARLWDGNFHVVPRSVAVALADRARAGDTHDARLALALADRQLDGPRQVRAIGLELIDRLLCIASHPESGLQRDQILALLGPNAIELVPRIDLAWNQVGSVDHWELLNEPFSQARGYASSRRLDDGTYVIWDPWEWKRVHREPGDTWEDLRRKPDLGPVCRRSPAADL